MKTVSIIGGGPAALMLAAHINVEKYHVTLYEKKKTVGRKFLVAGEGGLNLTFNASKDELTASYHPSSFMSTYIRQFAKTDLINWLAHIGINTFIGSSQRVFPDPSFKPIDVLNKIVQLISLKNINIHYNTEWKGWDKTNRLIFDGLDPIDSDIVVFALGGASWKVTGSDGLWNTLFEHKGITVKPFKAANCSFKVNWEDHFINSHHGKPLKNISLRIDDYESKGELVITKFGLEGNAIYALSQKLQEMISLGHKPIIHLDLKPTMSIEQIKSKYVNSKFVKPTDILKNDLRLNRVSIALIKQFSNRKIFKDPNILADTIKSIPISIHSADHIDRAISTLGGIDIEEIDKNLHLKKIPNSYVIGEMIDWYAPTGGYLLQGCFSMAYSLAKHLNDQES